MRKSPRPLFYHFFIPTALLLTVITTALGLLFFGTLRSSIYREHYSRLETTGTVLAAALEGSDRDIRDFARETCTHIPAKPEVRLTFIDPDGLVFADTHESPEVMENHAQRTEIRQALYGKPAFSLRESPTLDRPMLYYALPLKDRTGAVTAALRISTAVSHVQTTLTSAGVTIAVSALLLLALTVLLSIVISKRITTPLRYIAQRADQYARFDFTHPIYTEGPAEIMTTARALQKMSRALARRIDDEIRQKQDLEAVLTGMSEAVLVLDHNMIITELNPAASRLLDFPVEPVIGKSLIQVMRHTELDAFARQILSEGGAGQCPLILPGEPRERHLQVKASVIDSGREDKKSGAPILRLILVMNDITTLKRLEQIRKDFVANVSHELKTPMTSIKGFAETLLDGAADDPETARRFLRIIQNQTGRLVNIIEDLLALSRLEQNDEESLIQYETISLENPVTEAVSLCTPRAEEKETVIHRDCPGDLTVAGNGRLLEQAVLNLVDNAIKYCPAGSRIEVTGRRNDEGGTVLTISDNGPGIPEEDQDRIFERFYRVEKARSREMGGTGLGLSIVKHTMLVHGGRVTLESRPGKGSAFRLHFPPPGSD